MKNAIVFYANGTKEILNYSDDKMLEQEILSKISVRSGVIDIDIACIDENYRLIINDDYFEEDELVKNIEASKISKNRDVFGTAVLVKVKNNFDSGLANDVVEMTKEELNKFYSLRG